MDEAIIAEERAYWDLEVQRRTIDVEAARARGDAPHRLAGAEVRLKEAVERLAAMLRSADPT
jgi:hypothetical protein